MSGMAHRKRQPFAYGWHSPERQASSVPLQGSVSRQQVISSDMIFDILSNYSCFPVRRTLYSLARQSAVLVLDPSNLAARLSSTFACVSHEKKTLLTSGALQGIPLQLEEFHV